MKSNINNTANNVTTLMTKALFTLLVLFQLTGCYSAGGSNTDTTQAAVNTSQNATIDNNNGASSTSAIKLSWVAPVARSNQSPISMAEIAGYRIYYGTAQGVYAQQVNINDAYTNEIDLNVPTGNYYLVITTIDSNGLESAFSSEININV